MGLDVVELIIEVEEAFDVQIPDDRVEDITTVGGLYDFIVESMRATSTAQDVCLSAAAFYKIRRAVVAELGLNPKTVRPSTALEATLPRSDRRALWSRLQSATYLKLPTLVRPKWVTIVSTAIWFVLTVGVAWLTYRIWGAAGAVFVTFGAMIAIGKLVEWLTVPLATRFCASFATFRGLAKQVLARNYAALSRQFGSWSPADVWDALKLIIVEQLGVKPEQITREASFVKDFGAD